MQQPIIHIHNHVGSNDSHHSKKNQKRTTLLSYTHFHWSSVLPFKQSKMVLYMISLEECLEITLNNISGLGSSHHIHQPKKIKVCMSMMAVSETGIWSALTVGHWTHAWSDETRPSERYLSGFWVSSYELSLTHLITPHYHVSDTDLCRIQNWIITHIEATRQTDNWMKANWLAVYYACTVLLAFRLWAQKV